MVIEVLVVIPVLKAALLPQIPKLLIKHIVTSFLIIISGGIARHLILFPIISRLPLIIPVLTTTLTIYPEPPKSPPPPLPADYLARLPLPLDHADAHLLVVDVNPIHLLLCLYGIDGMLKLHKGLAAARLHFNIDNLAIYHEIRLYLSFVSVLCQITDHDLKRIYYLVLIILILFGRLRKPRLPGGLLAVTLGVVVVQLVFCVVHEKVREFIKSSEST